MVEMRQDINLYLLLPQSKKPFLTFKKIKIAYISLLFLLIMNFCSGWWHKHQQNLQIRNLTAQQEKLQANMIKLTKRYPRLDLGDIEKSVKQLQLEVGKKNNVFNMLENTTHFSNFLTGLAKSAVTGVWLVNITADSDDQKIELKGYALKTEVIQAFINNLQKQSEFSPMLFQLQEVTKAEVNKEVLLNFTISTKVTNTS